MTDQTAPRPGTRTGCAHCGQPIVFEPYFLDGKLPNPPVWAHTSGAKTCSKRPKGWSGMRWPFAEPAPTPGPCPACRRAAQAGLAPTELHDECAQQQPAHDASPDVAECAAADRAHWVDKYDR